MAEKRSIFADRNPWHGWCCRFCYVYRQDEMYGSEIASDLARKTVAFNLPVEKVSVSGESGVGARPCDFD